MEGYIVSIQANLLRVSLAGTNRVAEKKIGVNLKGHEILAEELGELILKKFGPKPPKLPLYFLIDPQDIYLNFLTVSKGNDTQDHLFEQAKSKLGVQGIAIEDLYFSYQKIAPFVYQLVAVDKDKLEKYLEVATDLELELKAIVPWVLLLPKLASSSGEPAIIVLNIGKDKFLVLSELGGIYHLGLLDNTKSPDELEELIQKLSVYQRDSPITDIYTLNMKNLKLGDKYKVSPLGINDLHKLVEEGCSDPVTLENQLNLLTLLPLPQPAKKASPAVYVGGVMAALLLVGGFFGIRALSNRSSDADTQLAQSMEDNAVVLSEVNESTETTEATEATEEDVIGEAELNKGYLRVRVENGTEVEGLAGKTRDLLVGDGYDVVGIGDAEESDRVKTLVRFSLDNAIYKDLLVEDLRELYESVVVTEDLEEDLEYDVLVIVGTDDVEEEQ